MCKTPIPPACEKPISGAVVGATETDPIATCHWRRWRRYGWLAVYHEWTGRYDDVCSLVVALRLWRWRQIQPRRRQRSSVPPACHCVQHLHQSRNSFSEWHALIRHCFYTLFICSNNETVRQDIKNTRGELDGKVHWTLTTARKKFSVARMSTSCQFESYFYRQLSTWRHESGRTVRTLRISKTHHLAWLLSTDPPELRWFYYVIKFCGNIRIETFQYLVTTHGYSTKMLLLKYGTTIAWT